MTDIMPKASTFLNNIFHHDVFLLHFMQTHSCKSRSYQTLKLCSTVLELVCQVWQFYIYITVLSKCKKSEKTSECQFTRKRVKATQKKLLSTRKREKREKKWDFSLEKEWKKSESEHEWTPLKNVLSSV